MLLCIVYSDLNIALFGILQYKGVYKHVFDVIGIHFSRCLSWWKLGENRL